jgi:hypothetical protein
VPGGTGLVIFFMKTTFVLPFFKGTVPRDFSFPFSFQQTTSPGPNRHAQTGKNLSGRVCWVSIGVYLSNIRGVIPIVIDSPVHVPPRSRFKFLGLGLFSKMNFRSLGRQSYAQKIF